VRSVDEYVEELYKQANQKLPETKELKEETRIHLNESLQELIMSGHSANDAFNIAIERFGGFEQAEKLIALMQIRQRKFAKWLLRIGVFSLLAVSSLFIFSIYFGNIQDARFADIGYKAGENVSKLSTKQMNSLFLDKKFLISASIYDKKSTKLNFNSNKAKWVPALFKQELYYGTDQSFVTLEVIDVRTISFFLFSIGFTIYYVLFTVWGLIQLYDMGRLSFIWILILILFNVLGYGFFYLKNRDKSEH
jgi:hypothetical protein